MRECNFSLLPCNLTDINCIEFQISLLYSFAPFSGLDCNWELLHMFNCNWDGYRDYCYVSHPR